MKLRDRPTALVGLFDVRNVAAIRDDLEPASPE